MSTFVLIPGAGGAAWYWHRVVRLLQEAGHEAIAVDLPGDDEHAGLPEYTRQVVDAIGDRHDVVLVAQSLGGFTAALVAATVRLRALVFVNAMIPSFGETPGAWWGITGWEQARTAAAELGDYGAAFDLGVYFLHDVPPEIAAAGEPHQRPEADAVFGSACDFAAWPSVPIRVVAGADDRFFPVEFQRKLARDRLGLEADVLTGGHLIALSQPTALATYLLGVLSAGRPRTETPPMPAPHTLLSGLTFGESPRWHAGRLWFANWGTGEVVAVDPGGTSQVMLRVPTTFPYSIDWLPDGRLLVVSGREALLLREEPDGSVVTHADLSHLGRVFNELVVDGRGNAYVNGGDFDPVAGGEITPGVIALVTPGGAVRQVADGIAFGNGMVVTPDNATLIVAESYGNRLTAFDIAADGNLSNRRVWADLDGFPDGICLDADGAIWYADVPNKRCVRVREGGEVLQTIDLDRGCFACMLGGAEGRTLFITAAEWRGMEHVTDGARTGQVVIAEAPAPGGGWP